MSEIPRLRWLCRRGMKELDVVMSGYLDRFYADASPSEQATFKTLLDMPDPDLWTLLVGRTHSSDSQISNLIGVLRTQIKRV